MTKRLTLTILIGLFSFPALAGQSWAQMKTVKTALTSKEVLDNLPFFVGLKMGFFKEAGIDLQPSYFRGGGEVVRALTTGSVDISGTNSPAALMIAASKGEPIKIVSGGEAPLVGVLWVVKADSPIKSVKDLRGKKVGYSSPGSVTHTTIAAILKTEGLEKETQIIRVGTPGDSWAAVLNGVVDVGWHVSPPIYTLVAKKEARIIINAADYIKDYQQGVVAAMENVIKKDPDMIRNFLKGRAKAVKFIYENSEKTIAIWAEELNLPVDAVRLAYQDLPRDFFEVGAPKTENLMGAMREAIGAGAMKEPLELKKILDLRFLP